MSRNPPSALGALILGNGSSLDRMPASFWSGAAAMQRAGTLMIVGTNRCLVMSTLFAHDVRLDAVVIRDSYHCLFLDSAVASAYHELWRACPAWRVGPAEDRTTDCDEFVRQVPGWQPEISLDQNREAAVCRNHSVVLSAANWAWLHGARVLMLLGVDYRGGFAHLRPPYTHAAIGWQGLYDRPVPPAIEREFSAARQAILDAGGSIVNLSPDSALQAI